MTKKKTYFVSDVHLGTPNFEESLEREKLLVEWLKAIREDAERIYLLGDIFDFWFEYKRVVPRGFTRFLGCISEIVDSGIPVYFFTGNHDIWVFDYLEKETGVKVIKEEQRVEINGKQFLIAHGDGLGPYDKKFNFLKKIFTNRFLQWCFKFVHPNFAIGFALRWSKHSRAKHELDKPINYEDEWLVKYSRSVEKEQHHDFYIYGHRHIPKIYDLGNNACYVNTGDWLINFTYAVFDGEKVDVIGYKDGLKK